MCAMERTTYRGSRGLNALTFENPRSDSRDVPHRSESSTDVTSDDSIPLFMSDLREPDPRKFASLAASRACLAASQRTSILGRIFGLAASLIAILAAALNSDVTSVLIDKSKILTGGATGDRSTAHAASADAGARPSEARAEAGAEAIVNADHTALRDEVAAAWTGNNEAAAPPKTLDAETLAVLTTRAKNLLALGDIAGARLLLKRAANAQDATAAFLLAQTYDPTVLGGRDKRSIAPDLVMARDWYRKAASFGSVKAQQRLAKIQN
jgi:deoxycytidylate deaminase